MKTFLKIAFVLFVINLAITVTIDRFKNPQRTETQIFEHIPYSFIWDFK